MTDINEKLSALIDGELSSSEIDELLMNIDNDGVQDKLKDYAQLSAIISKDKKRTIK
jgi:negative regulator of sigma E activity